MAVSIYINFNGNCREAVEFYADVFGAEKQKIMTFGDGPPNPDFVIPEEVKNYVMHTFLNINGTMFMFSDTFPGKQVTAGNNISVVITDKNMDNIKSIFNKLKQDGKVELELQETFWSKCYGMLTDKFGIAWQLSHEGENS